MENFSKTLKAACVVGSSLIALNSPMANANFMDQFIDKKDGKIDASEWILENSVGFMPVPIVITEPAVGAGGGAALLFFHESEEQKKKRKANPEKVSSIPPGVTGAVGAATSNGTKLGGVFHMNNWKDDSIRYLGAIFAADVNLKYYAGPNAPGLDFNAKAQFMMHDLEFRIGQSNFFVGGDYTIMKNDITFDLSSVIPGVDNIELNSVDASMGLKVKYDSLDNTFSAQQGLKVGLEGNFHHKNVGSDFDYQDYHAYLHSYNKLSKKWGLAIRGDVKTSTDGTPFYAKPFIDMRGIPAMRYQADEVAVGEVEVRYNIDERWTVLGFVGAGKAVDSDQKHDKVDWQAAQGAGFRYLIARQLGMGTGVDIAKGPEEWTIYLQMGGAW